MRWPHPSTTQAAARVVQQALHEQLELLGWFPAARRSATARCRRGASTGGLWSQLLTERHRELLEGVLSLCGYQVGSAVPWNLGLDFGFTVKTLPPEAWNRQLPM